MSDEPKPTGIKKVLPPVHISEETAYLIDDYPYGFQLRCKLRIWIETNKHGQRTNRQTTNPKIKDKIIWNKEKKSIYTSIRVLYIDENDHVHDDALSIYDLTDETKIIAFQTKYAEALGEREKNLLEQAKKVLEKRRETKK